MTQVRRASLMNVVLFGATGMVGQGVSNLMDYSAIETDLRGLDV